MIAEKEVTEDGVLSICFSKDEWMVTCGGLSVNFDRVRIEDIDTDQPFIGLELNGVQLGVIGEPLYVRRFFKILREQGRIPEFEVGAIE